jgi:hypothetical protein
MRFRSFASFGSFAVSAGFGISAFCHYVRVLAFRVRPDRFWQATLVQTLPAKKAPLLVSPKPDWLKVKVVPAEPAKTAKTISVQSILKKPDHEDLPAKDDEDVQEGYGEYLNRIEETDSKPKEGTQTYWD